MKHQRSPQRQCSGMNSYVQKVLKSSALVRFNTFLFRGSIAKSAISHLQLNNLPRKQLIVTFLSIVITTSVFAQNEFPPAGPVIIDGKLGFRGGSSNGTVRGIWFWRYDDPNHVIYSAAPTGTSPAGANATTGLWNSNHRLRFRTATTQGFLFENNQEQALIDINSNNGDLKSIGVAHFLGSGSNYFSGNLGIGTSSPDSKLSITASVPSTTTQAEIYNPSNADGSVAGLRFHTASGWDVMLRTNQQNAWLELTDASGNWKHRWYSDDYYTMGKVGIGTTSPTHKLEVAGTVRSKEVKVEAAPWPDYVFEADYDLPSLESIEKFIQSNKHLPEVPSAAEVEAEGLKLGEMNALLLKKIEELTLYVIELKKENKDQDSANIELRIENGELRAQNKETNKLLDDLAKRLEKLEQN